MEPNGVALRVEAVDEVVGVGVTEAAPAAAVGRADLGVAFVDFYRLRRDAVAGALALTLGDVHLGAEAADEAMARAFQRWEQVGAFADPSAWVYRVGLNWATSILRRRRWAVPAVERQSASLGPVGEPAVTAALADLPLAQRSVIVCRYFLGMSERETAAALHIRPGTAKSRLSRGLQQLQVSLAHLRTEET